MVAADSGENSDREENQTGNCIYLQLRASTDSGQGNIFVSRFRDGITEMEKLNPEIFGRDRDEKINKSGSRNFRDKNI